MTTTINQRINIVLPQPTIRLLDRVAPKGNRSRLINEAVHFYIETQGQANLQKMIREGAKKRAARDLSLAQEWFALGD